MRTTSNDNDRPAHVPLMVIAGASGVVGRHLVQAALADGWRVRKLTRRIRGEDPPGVESVVWRPRRASRGEEAARAQLSSALEGADALVNLAGATLADGRLDPPHRRRVLESRVDATRALVHGWLRALEPPLVWVQASAVGYYGDTGDAEVDESQGRGKMFLSEVCHAWEETADSLYDEAPRDTGPRQIVARIGLVLSEDAPAWEKLLQPIRYGVGGRIGSGEQWWAWIDADELARALLFLVKNPDARGVYNMTTPEPVRQIELTRGAARRLDRPAFMPAPAFALRLALGGVADELLLPSCKAMPTRLLEAGYTFERPDVAGELDHLLG